MTKLLRMTCLAASVAATAIVATPAAAAPVGATTPATARARIVKPLSLTHNGTLLDFGRLIVSGAGEGSATLLPDGTRQVSGSVEALGLRAMVGEASVRGEPGRSVRIDLPARIELYSMAGGRVTIDEVVADIPAVPKLDSAGNLKFRFGGRIRLSGNSDGDFRGDLPITVEYL